MAIAFDTFSNATPGTGNLTWTHTPVGVPRGVLVFVVQNANATDQVSGVTYGGQAMVEMPGSPLLRATGETGGIYSFGLAGRRLLSGAQSVVVTVSGSATKLAGCLTVTAAGKVVVEAVNTAISSTSQANPSSTLALGGRASFVAMALHSGQNAVSGITPRTGWAGRYEFDYGSQTGGIYSYNTIGTANVTIGWTQTAEDALGFGVALREAIPAIYARIKTMADGIAIERNGVLREIARTSLPPNVTEAQAQAALEVAFGGKLDDLHIHINDDFSIVFATGEDPPEVWPEDEIGIPEPPV